MSLGQEHIPETESSSLLLELIDDGGIVIPSGITTAQLSLKDWIGTGGPLVLVGGVKMVS